MGSANSNCYTTTSPHLYCSFVPAGRGLMVQKDSDGLMTKHLVVWVEISYGRTFLKKAQMVLSSEA